MAALDICAPPAPPEEQSIYTPNNGTSFLPKSQRNIGHFAVNTTGHLTGGGRQ